MKLFFLMTALILTINSCTFNSMDFYVSPDGDDNNPGTKGRPFLSFNKAKEAVGKMIADGTENQELHVYFRGGTYFFDESAVIGANEFATGNNRVIFSAYQNEKPVFSAGKILKGWTKLLDNPPFLPEAAKGKVWVTTIPEKGSGKVARFLSIGTLSLVNAVSGNFSTAEDDKIKKPNSDFMGANYESPDDYSSFIFPKSALREWPNLSDIEVIVRPHYGWVVNILPLKAIEIGKNIAYTTIPATYFIKRLSGSGDDANPNLQVQNAIDYLDEPGEWVVNSVEKKIYYWPEKGEPSDVYYPFLQELIRVEGKEKDNKIVKNIVFRGITFAHGDRDTWDDNAIGLQHDWAIYNESDALLRFIDSESCLVDNCLFIASGGGGVRFDFYSQNNRLINSEFSQLGGVPVLLDGYGPGIKNANKNNEIINNEIHDCGQSYLHSPGIFIWQSGGNRIANNLIYNTPYCGMVISGPRPQFFNKKMGNRRELTGTVHYDEIEAGLVKDWNGSTPHINEWDKLFPYLFTGNNIIEYNEIRDVMQKMDDGNAIYLSGTGLNNVVRNNWVHHTISPHRQAGIRADDYAKGITISENIVYQFARAGIVTKYDTYITNNYVIDYVPTEMVNGETHKPLGFIHIAAWGPIKGGVLKRNIFYQSVGISAPFLTISFAPKLLSSLSEYPTITDFDIDSNLYFATGVYHTSLSRLEELKNQGVDSNSVVADPLFEGLEEAGFKLKSNSSAIKLGIKQIDFGKIGLRKEPVR